MEQESQFVFVPPHIERKLTSQESQLFRAINRKKLDGKIRQEILGIFDAYVDARERLKVEEAEGAAEQGISHTIGVRDPSEIEVRESEDGYRVATPDRDEAEEDAAIDDDELPTVNLEEAEREWDKVPEHAFRKIANHIHGQIEQMNFGFFAGDDEESEEEKLVFHLLPRFPDKQHELMVFWHLALFLSGDHVDWLRGRCGHCKRFVINSDSRTKYCTPEHKDLYWRPRRREYHRQDMARRRNG
jgi:hypothetical protein